MMIKKKIAVFCGSASGYHPEYIQSARQLAELFVERNIGLVYGGANIGLMGELADRILELGGEAIGVIPDFLVDKEVAHANLTQMHIVSSMHERKIMMMELADSFVLLPGGAGSLDEFFEVMTLAQLGCCEKTFGILNVANYYDSMLNFLKHAVSEGFLQAKHLHLIKQEKNAGKLLDLLLHNVIEAKVEMFA